jgi:hypothetical protein
MDIEMAPSYTVGEKTLTKNQGDQEDLMTLRRVGFLA